jgi:hypothetical protein
MPHEGRRDEYGDFQTPSVLTNQVCKLLADRAVTPASVIEPTCGIGNFLFAALDQFPTIRSALGIEVNNAYTERLITALSASPHADKVRILRDSCFRVDWDVLLRDLPDPVLAIGNPPWVTNAELGAMGSGNLPRKTNFQRYAGLEALTGKSNFDISEWILITLIEVLRNRKATIAMVCKTAVARKVLLRAWKNGIGVSGAEIHIIDAAEMFGASVGACVLICTVSSSQCAADCEIYELGNRCATKTIGYRDGMLLADVAAYNRWGHLRGGKAYKWRSGIKHDCSRIMELRRDPNGYRNGHGELLDLEQEYVYPMLKSSEVANGRTAEPSRWMLVTQRNIRDDTSTIRVQAPETWKYLQRHGDELDRRGSTIYKKRPRFAMFGVGEYSFSPWKVAVSGFYPTLHFAVVGNLAEKPIVLDDTCYFVACRTQEEAEFLASLLNSPVARGFFSAFLFVDAKRPVTGDMLGNLDLFALARELGSEGTMEQLWKEKGVEHVGVQPDLFASQ